MNRVWALRAEREGSSHFLLAWSEEKAFQLFDSLIRDLNVPADHFTIDWCQMEVAA